jgi:hypothetical protein
VTSKFKNIGAYAFYKVAKIEWSRQMAKIGLVKMKMSRVTSKVECLNEANVKGCFVMYIDGVQERRV